MADKLGHEPWSNDQLAAFTRLAAHLNTRWARDNIPHADAGKCQIIDSDLMRIMGKGRVDVARTLARRLADIAEMSVEHRGNVTLIDWPNFPIFQEYGSRLRDLKSPLQDRDRDREKEIGEKPAVEEPRQPEASPPDGRPESDPQKALPLLRAVKKPPVGDERPVEDDERLAFLEDEIGSIDAWVADHPGRQFRSVAISFFKNYLKAKNGEPAERQHFGTAKRNEVQGRIEEAKARGKAAAEAAERGLR